jgi:hypothetical protein
MEASLSSFIVISITVSPLQPQQVLVGVNILQRTQSESKSGLSKATSKNLETQTVMKNVLLPKSTLVTTLYVMHSLMSYTTS